MKRSLLVFSFFSFIISLKATHNRAGEITYKWISGLAYEVTITTYTKIGAIGDNKCTLELFWGDNTSTVVKRANGPLTGPCPPGIGSGEPITSTVRKNIYIAEHTYVSSGIYLVYFEDPNRNGGVRNIPGSVNVPFYVQSEIVISPGLGPNSSPIFTNPPIDDGCIKRRFEHNAGAHDPDGDSLVYTLVPCRTTNGSIIPTTYDPSFVKDLVKIDPVKGDLIWDVPQTIAQYNFAFRIEEYRKNNQGIWMKIGYVIRDLQIDIINCANNPPIIEPIGPFCVEAGEVLTFEVIAYDTDKRDVLISLSASGGVFQIDNPADKFFVQGPPDTVKNIFRWQTACNHVRQQPHFVTFRAEDFRSSSETPLIDLYTVKITVVAPASKNPIAVANLNSISLNWDESICKKATGYKIYRRVGSHGFVPDRCETGVPDYTGYEFIGTTKGLASVSYDDSADLIRGIEYCYMVLACFADGAESYASEEFCASLPLTTPMITNVDITQTAETNGIVEIKWISPPVLDAALFPPPYTYKLYRGDEGIDENNFQEIGSFSGLNHTFYTDNKLNTKNLAYRYRVDLYSDTPEVLAGASESASSVRLEITPADESNTLEINYSTPWVNMEFIIFRENSPGSRTFEIIDTSLVATYIDSGLTNGIEYCYYGQTIGFYTANNSLPKPLINHSQITCSKPIDITSPCPPVLFVNDSCEASEVTLLWSQSTGLDCKDDIVSYNIYYKPTQEFSFPLQPFATTAGNSFFSNGESVVGCYAITAVDDANNDFNGEPNESDFSNIICVEACPDIQFPNVFSPGSDGINDFFKPLSFLYIESFTLYMYNRWGALVYETSDKHEFVNTGWDGTDKNTGQVCSDGVYYYICIYRPISLIPVPDKEIKGFVHLSK